jgi:hypothetical protein
LSYTTKKVDKQEYEGSNTAILSPYRVNKLDLKLSLNYTPAKRISLSLGYIFDLSRINNWEPYIAASNSLVLNFNFKF